MTFFTFYIKIEYIMFIEESYNMQFIKDLFTYFSENPVLTAVLIACFVFIGVVVAIICYLTAQAKKAEKALAEKTTLSSSCETETDVERDPVDETDFPEVKSSDETITREDTDPVKNRRSRRIFHPRSFRSRCRAQRKDCP